MGDTSTNLSKIKREHLLNICSRIKNKDEVDITEITELEQFIKSMKYGLTFEQHEEPVDAMLRTHVPVFKEFKEIIGNPSSSDCNFLLEGDNLHSLKLLEKTHKGRIDVIYIDPPYNTLNDDFAYGDKMIDEEDGFKHSKWLSFMKERLEIARKLLTDDGIVFISIDDREQANLKLLCDEIFGEKNFITQFIWESIFRPSNLSKKVRENCEYILTYSKTNNYQIVGTFEEAKGDFSLTQVANGEAILNCPANYVKVNFKDGVYSKKNYGMGYELLDDIIVKNQIIENSFRIKVAHSKWSNNYLQNEIQKGVTLIIKNEKSMVLSARKDYSLNELMPLKLIPDSEVKDVLAADAELKLLFNDNKPFDYPKPTSLIKWLLKRISNKSAIILDFFAGSGTTGHAVTELNQEDGGNRHFILCTNNEVSASQALGYIQSKGYMKDIKATGKNKTIQAKIDKFFEANPNVYQNLMIDNKFEYERYGICQSITYPRLNTVITGIRPDGTKYSDGIKTNLRYFQTDMVDKKDDDLDELLYEASFCLAELEHMSAIDGIVVCIAECDEDVENIIKNASDKLKIIFVADDVLLDDRQKEFFDRHHVNVKQIPNYYYKEV